MNANLSPPRRLGCSSIVFAMLLTTTFLPPAPVRAAAPADSPRADPAARMTVNGRVLDPQGKPVPGASVMAYARSASPGALMVPERVYPAEVGRATSDGSGRFRLETIRTSSSRHIEFGAVALAPGYGAGWADLDVDADQPSVDIRLRPEQVIQGRLFDLKEQPAAEVKLSVTAIRRVLDQRENVAFRNNFEGPAFWWLHPDDMPGWPRPVTTGADGRFTVHGAGPGLRVFLSVLDPRFFNQILAVDTDAGSNAKPPAFALQPARSFTGRVTYADNGKPVPHARVIVSGFEQLVVGVGPRPFLSEADAEGRFRANAGPGAHGAVSAAPPDGQPYLATNHRIDWPKGAIAQSVDLALPRGALIRGKVAEQGSGRPVAGAEVMDFVRQKANEAPQGRGGPIETAADGSFEMATSPRPGYLIIRGPGDDYAFQEIGTNRLFDGMPGGRRMYAHAFVAHDAKPGGESQEVRVVLRRGATVKGRVLGPDGQPVPETWLFSRVILSNPNGMQRLWRGDGHGTARNGRFEVHGLDPDAEVPVHFLDPKQKVGATVLLSGKSATGGPITVRLEPCGTATARLVGPDGKPIGGFAPPRLLWMVVTPGPLAGIKAQEEGALFADYDSAMAIDPINHAKDPTSDAQGRIAFPALIPGATYRIIDFTTIRSPAGVQARKEFTAKPGEALDLGDIRIEKPPAS
ncbi:MAG: carboxypeptidase-like regulatory domain-containing protein [Isosphaeraceae bacterium]